MQTAAMMLTALLIPGLRITGLSGAVLTVVGLAFVNSKLWDAALFFNIPDTLSIQVVMLFLSNGLIFWLLVKLLPGIEVSGFLPALIAPIVFTVINLLVSRYAPLIDWQAVFDFIKSMFSILKSKVSAFHSEADSGVC